ncbi:carbonic anhydrase [Candidatus Obscuribacterales bacterium]|jgi:carbonic anhydrase|nr:carbonic anhydrase [Candidatus Obscuribacterales bacterium]MBX3153513.1 carbonic anhydrase [Candidatus Obscuribacterales bacterium]
MRKLISGLHHFQSNMFESRKELFERLATGQNPDALFITCSDSRINPNLLTNTEPGDLFILRNAGNIIPAHGCGGGEAATIEFAVAVLGVRDLIVCGHSACGAIKALLNPSSLNKLPSVRSWLSHAEATRQIIEDNYSDLDEEEKLNVAIQENVLAQIENLRTLPMVASRLLSGNVHIHGWTYKIQTGEVFSYSLEEGQFLPVSEVENAVAQRQLLTAGVATL